MWNWQIRLKTLQRLLDKDQMQLHLIILACYLWYNNNNITVLPDTFYKQKKSNQTQSHLNIITRTHYTHKRLKDEQKERKKQKKSKILKKLLTPSRLWFITKHACSPICFRILPGDPRNLGHSMMEHFLEHGFNEKKAQFRGSSPSSWPEKIDRV